MTDVCFFILRTIFSFKLTISSLLYVHCIFIFSLCFNRMTEIERWQYLLIALFQLDNVKESESVFFSNCKRTLNLSELCNIA